MAVRFRVERAIDVGIEEPSDVTTLPGGAFFVVSDVEHAGTIVHPTKRPKRVALPGGGSESGFEAVAWLGGQLVVAREEAHELALLRWNGRAGTKPTLVDLRGLPPLALRAAKKGKGGKKAKNKGVEGMTFLPARLSPTKRAQLVLAKEGKPRALVLLAPDGSGTPIEIELDAAIEAACDDFSGLALDPVSGHLFVCSDESATVAEVVLEKTGHRLRAETAGVTALEDPGGNRLERVEGVTFDAKGDLFVLLENDCVLWRFARERR